jgi:hypothetical protein
MATVAAQSVADAGGGVLWRELRNKLRAWELFSYADRYRVHQVQCGAFEKVWISEGLGYVSARGSTIVEGLPAVAHVPLHTGLGLALAEDALTAARRTGDLSAALRSFRETCVAAAAPGFFEAAYEALGLVAVTMHTHWIGDIDQELLTVGDFSNELFWHGAGRGLYFTPLAFLPAPSTRRRGIDCALNWPSSALGRRNAIAGLIWAVTLVNIGDPPVLESWLGEYAAELQDIAALSNGVASALIVWESAAPGGHWLDALEGYRPQERFSAELWDSVVVQACRAVRPLVASPALAAEVFRLRPLSEAQRAAEDSRG